MIIPNKAKIYNSYFHKYKNISILTRFSQTAAALNKHFTHKYHQTIILSPIDKNYIRFVYKMYTD